MNTPDLFPRQSRRTFIKYSSAAFGAVLSGPYLLRGANLNSKLDIAVIGAGGKGSSDTDHCATENIVALCDVDQNTLNSRKAKYRGARTYKDFRKMLAEMKNIDAVIVSTPDHTHAAASVMAMKMGKHVYCQKPLTHSVHEARVMAELAADKKLATQLGTQRHCWDNFTRVSPVRSKDPLLGSCVEWREPLLFPGPSLPRGSWGL